MKKLIFVLIITALILPVYAQSNSLNEGELYYINIPIEKIYLAYEGYVIQYRQGINRIGTVGIPYDWFTNTASNAELIKLQPGKQWPSMSVFYRNGEFAFVKLYIHRSHAHTTWGVVPMGADVSMHFTSPESFRIEF